MGTETFGVKIDDQDYQTRVGVHIVIFDQKSKKILLVSPLMVHIYYRVVKLKKMKPMKKRHNVKQWKNWDM